MFEALSATPMRRRHPAGPRLAEAVCRDVPNTPCASCTSSITRSRCTAVTPSAPRRSCASSAGSAGDLPPDLAQAGRDAGHGGGSRGLAFPPYPACRRRRARHRRCARSVRCRRASERLAAELRPDILHAHSPVLNAIPAIRAGRRSASRSSTRSAPSGEDAAVDHGTTHRRQPALPRRQGARDLGDRSAPTTSSPSAKACADIVGRGIRPTRSRSSPTRSTSVLPAPATPTRPCGRARPRRHHRGGLRRLFYAYEGSICCSRPSRDPLLQKRPPSCACCSSAAGRRTKTCRLRPCASAVADKVVFTGRVPLGRQPLLRPDRPARLSAPLRCDSPSWSPAQAARGHGAGPASSSPPTSAATKELIRDGETGRLFKAGSAEALAAAIDDLLAHRERWPAMRAAGGSSSRCATGRTAWRITRRCIAAWSRSLAPRHEFSALRVCSSGCCRARRRHVPTRPASSPSCCAARARRSRPQVNAPYRPAWVERLKGVRALFGSCPTCCGCGRPQGGEPHARDGQLRLVLASLRRAGGVDRLAARRAGGGQLPRRRGGRLLCRSAAVVRPPCAARPAWCCRPASCSKLRATATRAHRLQHRRPRSVSIPRRPRAAGEGPHLVVARNLEALYGNDTALRARGCARPRRRRLSIAGSGRRPRRWPRSRRNSALPTGPHRSPGPRADGCALP